MAAHADWMSQLSPRLWDVPLHLLSIPGSHNAVTYSLSASLPASPSQLWPLRLLDQAAPCVTRPAVRNWSATQTLDVTQQLDAGVRFLDLRVAQAPGGSARNLRFLRGLYTDAMVEDTLTEVSEWLERHPGEVVLLGCRDFEGVTGALHEYLAGCVRNIFGASLCPRGEVPSLCQLWSRGQQVLVSYDDEATVGRHAHLWPGIPRWRAAGGVGTDELLAFLDAMRGCGRPGGLFLAGLHLTPSPAHMLAHPASTLRAFALPRLPRLTTWAREQRPGPAPGCTNILAGDFVGDSTLVGDVIALNGKLLAD